MQYITDFKEGQRIKGVYLCKSRVSAVSKNGKEYETLVITDKTGQIEVKIWDPSSAAIKEFDVNNFIEISGDITAYMGKLQCKALSICVADKNDYVESDYMSASRFNLDEMMDELYKIIGTIKNPYIHELLENIFIKNTEFAERFKTASAAKSVHHGYLGGLLEHSLSVAKLCIRMCANYDYLNYDLLVSSAMLHDIGKTREISPFPENDYTDEGNLIGHIVIGYGMLHEEIAKIKGFPEILAYEMEHCMITHHGKLEYGSPKIPALVEAKALAMADNMDAHLEIFREDMEKKNTNAWHDYNKFLESRIRRTEV